jgi:hypothetical protein
VTDGLEEIGWQTALTRRGLAWLLPGPWHCSRRGQGRQWQIRAA